MSLWAMQMARRWVQLESSMVMMMVLLLVHHWKTQLASRMATPTVRERELWSVSLWAMTTAPVAVVAALRETSILFGAAIAVLVLKERVSPARIVAVCVIAGGAAILRMA